MLESNFSSFLQTATENGVTILADINSSCPKKSTIYYNEDFKVTRWDVLFDNWFGAPECSLSRVILNLFLKKS